MRTWLPEHGIVFGDTTIPAGKTPIRASSTINGAITANGSSSNLEIPLPFTATRSYESPSTNNGCLSPAASSESSFQPSSQEEGSQDFAGLPSQHSQVDEVNDFDEERKVVMETPTAVEEAHSQLTFHIPKDVLQNAQDAEPGSKESYWSYKLYTGSNNEQVKVHYCRSKHTTERVAQYFENEKVIGFDIEWLPSSRKGRGIKQNVSLIQVASETRIALFHIALFPKDTADDLVAPTLKRIMEDPEITKVGVAIKGDCTRLRNFLNIDPRGIFELSHLYKLVKHTASGNLSQVNKILVSVATQVEEHLGLPIYKGEVRGSDWTQPLTLDQIIYAASDAYANLMLFDTLESKRKQLHPTPPRPHHAELNLPISLASGSTLPENDDTMEDVAPAVDPESTGTKPASTAEAAAENVQIEEDGEPANTTVADATCALLSRPRTRAARSSKSAPAQLDKSPEVIAAEQWASLYRQARQPSRQPDGAPPPSPSALRVYALWHDNPHLSVGEIAALLRDPPLKPATVCHYILECVRMEELPVEGKRLRDVLVAVPGSRNTWRYKGLWKMVLE
jgi:hypothetical protein